MAGLGAGQTRSGHPQSRACFGSAKVAIGALRSSRMAWEVMGGGDAMSWIVAGFGGDGRLARFGARADARLRVLQGQRSDHLREKTTGPHQLHRVPRRRAT